MNINFTPVTEADFDRLADLRVTAMRESLERAGRFDPDRARARLRNSFSPAHTCFIVFKEEIAGFYAARPSSEGLQLDHLYIHPRFQGRGIGGAVMRKILNDADESGVPILVGALKESASNRFYQRHGFSKTGESEWDIYYIRPPSKDEKRAEGQISTPGEKMPVHIQRATSADLDAASGVIREAADWLASKGMPMWMGPAFEPAAIAAGLNDFYLAFAESELAGVVKLETEDLIFWPDVTQGESLFIHRLAVRRAFSGGRISFCLLDFARAEAQRRGLNYLRLDCAADRPRLRKIYQDFGFRHHSDRTAGPFAVARYEYKIR